MPIDQNSNGISTKSKGYAFIYSLSDPPQVLEIVAEKNQRPTNKNISDDKILTGEIVFLDLDTFRKVFQTGED